MLTLLSLSLLEFLGHFCTVWPLGNKNVRSYARHGNLCKCQLIKHKKKITQILSANHSDNNSLCFIRKSTANCRNVCGNHKSMVLLYFIFLHTVHVHIVRVSFIPLESQKDLFPTSSACWLGPGTSGMSSFLGFRTRHSF